MLTLIYGSKPYTPCDAIIQQIDSYFTNAGKYETRIYFLDHRMDTRISFVNHLMDSDYDHDYSYTVTDCTCAKLDDLIKRIRIMNVQNRCDSNKKILIYFNMDSFTFTNHASIAKYVEYLHDFCDNIEVDIICLNTIRALYPNTLKFFNKYVFLKNTSSVALDGITVHVIKSEIMDKDRAQKLRTMIPCLNPKSSQIIDFRNTHDMMEEDYENHGSIVLYA